MPKTTHTKTRTYDFFSCLKNHVTQPEVPAFPDYEVKKNALQQNKTRQTTLDPTTQVTKLWVSNSKEC